MRRREASPSTVLLGFALVLAGCGDDTDGDTTATGGAAGFGASPGSGGDATAIGGSPGLGGAAATGAAPGAGGAGTSGGGSGATDCGSAAFGEPRLLFTDPGYLLATPTLPADELELFYDREVFDAFPQDARIGVRRRAARSEAFGEFVELPAIAAVCRDQLLDVGGIALSADGLRLYLSCTPRDTSGDGPLYLGVRANRSSEFAFGTSPVGEAGPTLGLSLDELSLVTVSQSSPRLLTRARVGDPFGPAEPLAGVGDVVFMSPELSPDGLAVFGAILDGTQNPSGYRLARMPRASALAPFDPPSTLALPAPPLGSADGSPAFGAGCRALYFVRRTSSPEQPYASEYSIHVSER